MSRRKFRAAAVSALTGMSSNYVLKWNKIGLLIGQRAEEPGQGRAVYFDELALFVAVLCWTVCRQGLDLTHVKIIADFLNGKTIEEIEEAAAANKVLVAAGSALLPRFVDFNAVAINEAVAEASKSGLNEILLTMSMATAWKKFEAGLRHYDEHLAAPLN